jgi:predicted nucleic acid-binding protein
VAVFVPDASCMVAAICAWHQHHERARKEIEGRLRAGETLVSIGHALIETYSVLTRLPPPHRLSPEDARNMIAVSFERGVTVVGADHRLYRRLLAQAPESGTSGGRIYDALITACARKAGPAVLLTFNVRHFEGLDGNGLIIAEPGIR